MKIQLLDQSQLVRPGEFWLSASSLIAGLRGGTVEPPRSEPIVLSDMKACPMMRLVSQLSGVDDSVKQVPRMVPELKLLKTQTEDIWRMSVRDSGKTSPAIVGKTYVACEVFSESDKSAMSHVATSWRNYNGVDYSKALAMRIIEVRREKSADGTFKYVPLEDYGGFVQTWIYVNGSPKARILVGQQLDAQTWSAQK